MKDIELRVQYSTPVQAGQTQLSIPDDVEALLRSQRQLSGRDEVSLDKVDTGEDNLTDWNHYSDIVFSNMKLEGSKYITSTSCVQTNREARPSPTYPLLVLTAF